MEWTTPSHFRQYPRWIFSCIVKTLIKSKGRPIAIIYLFLIAVTYTSFGAVFWRPMHNLVFDTYQRLFPRKVDKIPVMIVDIDDSSLATYGRWPWPRTRLAELIRCTHNLGALAIGFDIIMPEPDNLSPDKIFSNHPEVGPDILNALARLPSNDDILVQTLKETPSVVARAAIIDSEAGDGTIPQQTPAMIIGESPLGYITSYKGHVANIPPIEKAAFGYGYLNDIRDRDGVVRSMPIVISVNGGLAPALSLELLRTAVNANWYSVYVDKSGVKGITVGESFIPTDNDGTIRLYFSPSYRSRRVSAQAVLKNELNPGAFKNQIVIIGVTGVGTIDIVTTPVAARMDGVEIQVQVIENILENSRLLRPQYVYDIELGIFIGLALILIIFIPRIYPGYGIILFVGLATFICAVSIMSFSRLNTLLDPSFPIAGNIVILVVQLTAGFSASNREKRELDAALEAERLERVRLSGELKAAREIQMSILPVPGLIKGLPPDLDFYAMIEPADEVGGDLYDAFMIDDVRFFFMVGDVAGKGVPASLFMALSKTLCKSTALRGYSSLNDLMKEVNIEISRENHAMLFVTAVAGIIDAKKGELQICSAGHESPILVRRGEPIKFLDIAGGPPLCVLDDYKYGKTSMQLIPGDLLVLISDGITEAQDPEQDFYGKERILKVLNSLNQRPNDAEGICKRLYEDVKYFTKGASQSDDLTIMVIRFI